MGVRARACVYACVCIVRCNNLTTTPKLTANTVYSTTIVEDRFSSRLSLSLSLVKQVKLRFIRIEDSVVGKGDGIEINTIKNN